MCTLPVPVSSELKLKTSWLAQYLLFSQHTFEGINRISLYHIIWQTVPDINDPARRRILTYHIDMSFRNLNLLPRVLPIRLKFNPRLQHHNNYILFLKHQPYCLVIVSISMWEAWTVPNLATATHSSPRQISLLFQSTNCPTRQFVNVYTDAVITTTAVLARHWLPCADALKLPATYTTEQYHLIYLSTTELTPEATTINCKIIHFIMSYESISFLHAL